MNYTKWQLEAMSDFEINMIIAQYDPAIINDQQSPSIQNESGVYMNDIVSQWVMDWCNKWEDMGPIIQRLNISLGSNDITNAYNWIAEKQNADKPSIRVRSQNPLRAAAIVYILIKQ